MTTTRGTSSAAILGLLLVCGFQNSPPQALLAELKEKAASDGLMIAGVLNRDLLVYPFSGSPLVRRFFNYDVGLARIAPDGTAVLVYGTLNDDPRIPAEGFALINSAGRVVAQLNPDVVNVSDFALASDRTAVVFAGKDRATGEVGIFVGKLGTAEVRLIVPLRFRSGVPEETSVAWTPDMTAVLFSRDGKVWTYDVGSRQTSLLFSRGTNPSCSPDGQWIAYRDPNGYAAIASRLGTGAKRASGGQIEGFVHWSPDSAYYFVDEKARHYSSQKCPFGSCFIVYRLRDGSHLELQSSDIKDRFFGWVHGSWSAIR